MVSEEEGGQAKNGDRLSVAVDSGDTGGNDISSDSGDSGDNMSQCQWR